MIFYSGVVLFTIIVAKLFFLNFLTWQSSILDYFWYCNLIALILSFTIVFFNKYSKKVASIVLTTAISAQTIWIASFVFFSFGYRNIVKLKSVELLLSDPSFTNIALFSLTFLVHILSLPLALYIVYKKGFDKKVLPIALILTYFLLTFSYIFSNDYVNLNCMKHSCDVLVSTYNTHDIVYYLSQIAYYFAAITATYFVLGKIFKK